MISQNVTSTGSLEPVYWTPVAYVTSYSNMYTNNNLFGLIKCTIRIVTTNTQYPNSDTTTSMYMGIRYRKFLWPMRPGRKVDLMKTVILREMELKLGARMLIAIAVKLQ